MILKLFVESFGTKEAAKGFSEVLSEAAISMSELGKTGASSSKQISKFFSALRSGVSKSLVSKISVASTITVAAITAIVAVCYNLKKASDEVMEKAQELGTEFKQESEEIKHYKERIEELYETINNESSSIEDVTDARKNLMTVQGELIDKYGSEKEHIESITKAINGQAEALDNLTAKQYQKKKNEFNKEGFWNNISNSLNSYDSNIDKMKAEMGLQGFGVGSGIYAVSEELKKALIEMGYNVQENMYGGGSGIYFGGTLREINEQISELQELESKFSNSDNKGDIKFFENLREEANRTQETLDYYAGFYDTYLLQDVILKDESLKGAYKSIIDQKEALDKAIVEGNEESIEEAKNNFAIALNEAITGANSADIKEYFKNMYPELQAEVATWNFKIKFSPDVEDPTEQRKVKGSLRLLEDESGRRYSAEELKNINPDALDSVQKQAYNNLVEVAKNSELDWEQFIDALVDLGEVQTSNQQQLLEVIGEEQLAGLSDLDIRLLESTPDVASIYKKALADEHVKDEIRKENKELIKSLNEDIAQAEDLGYKVGVEVTEDSPVLLQDIAKKQELIKQKAIEAGVSVDEWMDSYNPSVIKYTADASTRAINETISAIKAANMESSKLSFVEVQSNIQGKLSPGMDQLGSIYEDVYNKEEFDWSSILNNTGFKAEFGNLSKASEEYKNVYNEFIETISNSPDNIDACKEAFDRLATAYIQNSDALKGVTEETKNAAVAQLEQMGIVNAEEIVDYYIIKEKAAQLGVDFATATAQDILMLINEGIVAGETADSLFYYQLNKALSNDNPINTASDCNQLIALAQRCNVTGDVLKDLIRLREIYEMISNNAWGLSPEELRTLDAEAEQLRNSIKEQIAGFDDTPEPLANYAKRLDSAADASKNAKDATDALKEAIQQEIDALEKQKEALQDSLNELGELYDAIQWVLDGKIEDIDDIIEKIQEENDALAEQREIYDNILSVVDSVYNAEIEVIQEKIDALGEENEEQEKALALEEARRKVEEMRNNKTILQYTEDNGYVYVRDEAALKEAEDDFAEKSKELEESKIKKELEDQIELLKKYRDMWGEIPDAFEKSMNELEAMKHFGTDWKNAILNSDEGTIGEFQGNYTGLQENEKANEEKIDYYEEEKKKIEDLKKLWEDAKNAYRDSQYEAKLASFFGSDYEYQILNNSLTWRTRFTDEYCSLQMQIADIEEKIKALNEQSANIIADSATKVSNALNKTTEAVNGLKSSLSTEGSGGSNILSGVEASVDKSLLQIESLKIALSDLDLARKTLEETIDAEIIDTSKLVGETQTKVQEISIAISSLLLSIRLLRINIEELLTALLNINDTVTLDRVISLIGSGAEGSLLGAINSVIEKLSDANGGLLYELNQLNGKQLDFIIAEFNGDEGLLSAIKEVSSAILSAEDSECLVAKINSLTETIDSINTVKDSFELLETKVGNCVDKVTTLNEKIQGLQDKTITITVEVARHTTFTVDTAIGTEDIPAGIEIDNTELDDILATMPHGYAKGGIVGKKDESILDPYAESLGENHMVAVQNEEAIIPVNTVKANPELVSALLDADGKAINLSDKGISYKIAADSFNKNGNTFIPVDIPNLFGSAISGFNLDKVAPKYENKMNPESYVNTVSNENSVSITIGDIHLSGVQDVNNLSNQIINRLPNLLIQGIGRK